MRRMDEPFSQMIAKFGGYVQAAMVLASIYLLGIAATLFLPETQGQPLPG
jgi:hypothetical protein